MWNAIRSSHSCETTKRCGFNYLNNQRTGGGEWSDSDVSSLVNHTENCVLWMCSVLHCRYSKPEFSVIGDYRNCEVEQRLLKSTIGGDSICCHCSFVYLACAHSLVHVLLIQCQEWIGGMKEKQKWKKERERGRKAFWSSTHLFYVHRYRELRVRMYTQ